MFVNCHSLPGKPHKHQLIYFSLCVTWVSHNGSNKWLWNICFSWYCCVKYSQKRRWLLDCILALLSITQTLHYFKEATFYVISIWWAWRRKMNIKRNSDCNEQNSGVSVLKTVAIHCHALTTTTTTAALLILWISFQNFSPSQHAYSVKLNIVFFSIKTYMCLHLGSR